MIDEKFFLDQLNAGKTTDEIAEALTKALNAATKTYAESKAATERKYDEAEEAVFVLVEYIKEYCPNLVPFVKELTAKRFVEFMDTFNNDTKSIKQLNLIQKLASNTITESKSEKGKTTTTKKTALTLTPEEVSDNINDFFNMFGLL